MPHIEFYVGFSYLESGLTTLDWENILTVCTVKILNSRH